MSKPIINKLFLTKTEQDQARIIVELEQKIERLEALLKKAQKHKMPKRNG
jgi:hypothetical protein